MDTRQQTLDSGTKSTIIQLIRRGETIERIASICNVSPYTVERILDTMVASAAF